MMHDLIDDQLVADMERLFAETDNRFTTLVQTAGLDPARDLHHLNLQRIVLQPGEDIAGYDFTGCDLTGAVMRRVDLSGAVFTGAETAGMDCRGAIGLETALSADQRSRANVAPLPKALQYGPNRHWPEELAEEIERILQEADTADALRDSAQDAYKAGQHALEETLRRVLLDWDTAEFGPEYSITLTSRHNLAVAIMLQGCSAEAEAAFAALLPLCEKVDGPEHPGTLVTRDELARAILNQGRAAEAEAAFAALLPIREKVNGPEHPGTLNTRCALAWACLELGEAGGAREMLALLPEEGGDPVPSRIGETHVLRGWLADLHGKADVADHWLARAAQALAEFSPEHYTRRQLARYLETRVPGAAGGTMIPADLGVGDGVDRGRVGAPADS